MVILAAVGEEGQSAEVVKTAYDLALKYDDTLVVLHVVPEKDFEAHRQAVSQLPDFSNVSLDQEEGSAARFAEEVVTNVLEDYEYDAVEPVGRVGKPAEMILQEAESRAPRFLVIGGKQRSPVGKAVFGSVTQTVLLNASSPVVTVMVE